MDACIKFLIKGHHMKFYDAKLVVPAFAKRKMSFKGGTT